MLAMTLILITVILSVAHFYLKSGALVSFAAFAAAVFGVIVAFAYYEPLTSMLLIRGYGGQWASAGIYVVLFVVTFAVIRTAADFMFGQDVELGNVITRTTAIVCGILTGLIISGVVLIALAMAPIRATWPYARLGDGDSDVTIARHMRSPVKPLIRADGIVTGLFGWISRGSLSSKKSFAVYHADFLNQIHLNNYKAKEKVYSVAGNRAVRVPKKGVRKLDSNNDNLTVVRMEVRNADIKKGGARGPDGDVVFTLGQVRLICKKKGRIDTRGSADAVYPEGRIVSRRTADKDAKKQDLTGVMSGRVLERRSLDKIIRLGRDEFQIGGKSADARVDLAFEVPSDKEAVLLEFKQNVAVEVPASAPASEEAEQLLNSSGRKSPAGRGPAVAGPGDPNT
ncbi:MAG: hypothetical protein DRP66_02685 [Planctomycetota bacterium]|nr:MAG: hypothetical protein DRP66_02685 [Planctomycetota bacterium]